MVICDVAMGWVNHRQVDDHDGCELGCGCARSLEKCLEMRLD